MKPKIKETMRKSYGHMVTVVPTDGATLVGKCVDYTSSADNWDAKPPEPSITLRSPTSPNSDRVFGALVEIFASEIAEITISE